MHLFISDLIFFFTETRLSNYAANNSLFSTGKDIGKIKVLLAKDFGTPINWFRENLMVLNSKKCMSLYIFWEKTFTFKDVCYENSKEEAILGITTDNKLIFDSLVKKM